ncbi:MAG: imidazolonepropionase [Bdellovibrionales bacterium]|nr:imidazolonepropionase [Bdellovibrionales bacterium]
MEALVLYEEISQLLTLEGVVQKKGRRPVQSDLGCVENACMVVNADDNLIVWTGKGTDLPETYKNLAHRFSGKGQVWIPELVECHTHLIYGGTRHHDFALRCEGQTYQQIAAAGGGILTTMNATREAPPELLLEQAAKDLARFQKFGIGTLEIKTGYGLTLESELRALEVIRALSDQAAMILVPTFLPAHATPPEYKGRTDSYVDLICAEWLPEVAKTGLAKFFDVFVEDGYFSPQQAHKLFLCALDHGLKLKLHSDQFTSLGGTKLGIELGAFSIDHLDHISKEDIRAFGESNTVAVLLPGASLFTGTPYPPARALIDAGARVALSTDYNPGTCPSRNLPLMTTIACTQMKMTVPEAIAAVTYNAAAALDLEDRVGSLIAGKEFRVCTLDTDSYEALPYCFGELE